MLYSGGGEQSRKKIIVGIGAVLLLIVIGTSYAFWQINRVQESSNVIISDCLNLTLSDTTNAISLEKVMPITDEEANNLIPYEFKITNTCNTTAYFDINLEIMGLSDKLSSEYIAVQLDDSRKVLLNTKEAITPTYSDATYTADEAYRLKRGSVEGKGEVSYRLKL